MYSHVPGMIEQASAAGPGIRCDHSSQENAVLDLNGHRASGEASVLVIQGHQTLGGRHASSKHTPFWQAQGHHSIASACVVDIGCRHGTFGGVLRVRTLMPCMCNTL